MPDREKVIEQESVIESLKSDLHEMLEVVSGRLNVVRCKNCILRFTEKCILHDQAFPINKGNDWFCADGERRTDNA